MDLAQIMVTAGGLLLIVLVLWFFFGKGEGKRVAGGGAFSCPMHPWITSSDPTANCSICGMKLVRSSQGS
jgi:hypothetical protein